MLLMLDVFLCTISSLRILTCTGILDKRFHKREIGLLFDGDSSNAEISSQKTNGSVCLVAYVLYMSAPFKDLCNCKPVSQGVQR